MIPDEFDEEDKWASRVSRARRVLLPPQPAGGTTGMAAAEVGRGVTANTEAPPLSGRLADVPPHSARDEFTEPDDEWSRPYDSLLIVAGVVIGAAAITTAWWGIWKVVSRRWSRE